MREPAEAGDDVVVALGVVEKTLVILAPRGRDCAAEAPEGFDRQALQRDVLGVLERQVEERAGGRDEAAVERRGDAVGGETLRRRVLREGRAAIPVNVARELIEHDDEREPAARVLCPVRLELAAGSALVKRSEALAYRGVVPAAVAEPHLALRGIQRAVGAARAEPEVQYFVYFAHESNRQGVGILAVQSGLGRPPESAV